jgi:hypothetical protein
MIYILWILNVNIIAQIRLLFRANLHSIHPPLASSLSFASLRDSFAFPRCFCASYLRFHASPRGLLASPPQSSAASHNSQCCTCPLNARNYSRGRPLPPLLTSATFWYVSQISTDEGSRARVILSWQVLRCHQYLLGQTRPIQDNSHRSRPGPWERWNAFLWQSPKKFIYHQANRYSWQKVTSNLVNRV